MLTTRPAIAHETMFATYHASNSNPAIAAVTETTERVVLSTGFLMPLEHRSSTRQSVKPVDRRRVLAGLRDEDGQRSKRPARSSPAPVDPPRALVRITRRDPGSAAKRHVH